MIEVKQGLHVVGCRRAAGRAGGPRAKQTNPTWERAAWLWA